MRVPINEDLADKTFAWLWVQTPLVRDYIVAKATGTSPTMKKISQGIVQKIPFPIGIELDQQRKIAATFSELRKKLSNIESAQAQTLAELEALMPSALNRAYSGEI